MFRLAEAPGMNPWDTGLVAATLLEMHNRVLRFEKFVLSKEYDELTSRNQWFNLKSLIKQHLQIRGADG